MEEIASSNKKNKVAGKRGRPKRTEKPKCNCNSTHPCPLDGQCNVQNVIYGAELDIEEENESKIYVGQAQNFKDRWYNHIASFHNKDLEQNCNLKDMVWKLKDEGKAFTIKWKILRYSKAYEPGSRYCQLCLDEKLSIFDIWGRLTTINKDKAIMKPCIHKYKHSITY